MSHQTLQGDDAPMINKDRGGADTPTEGMVGNASATRDFIESITKFSRMWMTDEDELQSILESRGKSNYNRRLRDNELFDSLALKIETLILEGADVNTHDSRGDNPLVIITRAWEKADNDITLLTFMETIQLLLDHGANPNAKGRNGHTALGTSIIGLQRRTEEDFILFLTLLVEHGADIDEGSPLNLAATEGNEAAVQALLSKGANVDSQLHGKSPLVSILECGHFLYHRDWRNIRHLLEYGVNLEGYETQLLSEAIYCRPRMVEYILECIYGKFEPEPCLNDERLTLWNTQNSKATIQSVSGTPSGISANCLISPPNREKRATAPPRRIKISVSNTLGGDAFIPGLGSSCLYCTRFQKETVERHWFEHCPDSSTLNQTILGGCLVCRLIKDCLPDTFGAVSLYYYTTAVISGSRNYYDRILVRCETTGDFVFGELRLATLDDKVSDLLTEGNEEEGRETNSEPSFRLARHWMKTCSMEHGTACQGLRDSPPTLPTRVIDVSDISSDPYLLITNGKRGHYVTLSYCWGSTNNISATSDSLEVFQKSIPFQKIPKTIQDAITATRKLGIDYLWVDTLCILQDSDDDWLRESKAMASIYQNSTLTIAAADSEDSEGGLFRERARLRTRPVRFAPEIVLPSQPISSNNVFTFGDRQESNDGFKRFCRLDSRGWVLQEQLLSPRTLNFSSQELYWECLALSASESYPAGIPTDHDTDLKGLDFSSFKRMLLATSSQPNQARAHALWQQLIVLYTKRRLTVRKDKLIALAGAAHEASKLFDDTLLVGLWKKYLWRDLLWTVDMETMCTHPGNIPPEDFKAPSWSWASIDRPILYKLPRGTTYFHYSPCIQILRYGEKVHGESMHVSGFVELRGAMLPVTVKKESRSAPETRRGKPIANKSENIDILIPEWPTLNSPTLNSPTLNSPASDPPSSNSPASDSPASDSPASDSPASDPPAWNSPTSDSPEKRTSWAESSSEIVTPASDEEVTIRAPEDSSEASDSSNSSGVYVRDDRDDFSGVRSAVRMRRRDSSRAIPPESKQFSWVPDTEYDIKEPLHCLIVASSSSYIILLVLSSTGRRPDEYYRQGVAYWANPPEGMMQGQVKLEVQTISIV